MCCLGRRECQGWAVVRVRTIAACAVAAGLCGLTLVAVQSSIRHRYGLSDLAVLAALWLAFAAGALVVRHVPVRAASAVILVGGAAMQLAALTAPPHTSDDVYRYIWDGRVQAAGIDPYAYVPAAPELARVREGFLWPPAAHWCVPLGTPDRDRPGEALVPGCTRINRPAVHTIYPPAAEAYFLAIDQTSPAGAGTLPMQAGAAATAIAATALLLAGLRRLGGDPRLAVLWAWCPTVALEAGNGAHVDVLAAALTAAALLLLSRSHGRKQSLLGGGLLGLAVATKLYPALAAPAAARRRPAAVGAGAAAAIAAVYLPHLLTVGSRVLGFLPGYLRQEGYGSGARFAVARLVLPQAWSGPAAAAILLVVALIAVRTADSHRPWDGALLMTGTALILTSPAYPWYALLLVALAALAGRAEWLPLAAAGYLPLFGRDVGLGWSQASAVGYLTAAAVAASATLARAMLARSALRSPASGVAKPADPALCQPGAPREGRVRAATPRTGGVLADVVLPCLNETAALPYVLSRLPAAYRAIVVDNGSSDGSAQIARSLGAHVVHEPRRGFGAACHAGLLAASAPVVCFCDCDGSLDPAELPRVAGLVLAGEADLVLGRRCPTSPRAWPPYARIGNWLLARRIRRATGVTLQDLGPMRAARREPLVALGLRDRRFGYPLEMVLAAARAGWHIAETSVHYQPRAGRSKVTGTLGGTLRAARDMRRAWKAATG